MNIVIGYQAVKSGMAPKHITSTPFVKCPARDKMLVIAQSPCFVLATSAWAVAMRLELY